jgi:hypothetical protein
MNKFLILFLVIVGVFSMYIVSLWITPTHLSVAPNPQETGPPSYNGARLAEAYYCNINLTYESMKRTDPIFNKITFTNLSCWDRLKLKIIQEYPDLRSMSEKYTNGNECTAFVYTLRCDSDWSFAMDYIKILEQINNTNYILKTNFNETTVDFGYGTQGIVYYNNNSWGKIQTIEELNNFYKNQS